MLQKNEKHENNAGRKLIISRKDLLTYSFFKWRGSQNYFGRKLVLNLDIRKNVKWSSIILMETYFYR